MPDPRLLELLMRLLSNNSGNVDLTNQPQVLNPDGSISTVDSRGFNIDGKDMLLPSVTPDGRHLQSDADVLAEYDQTGRQLGTFPTQAASDWYGDLLHRQYAAGQYRPRTPRLSVNGAPMDPALGHRSISPALRAALMAQMKAR